MSQAIVSHDPREDATDLGEPGLISGRPAEDRSFEAVEAGVGVAAGLVIGTAVAGPIGTAIGGLVGAAAGLVAGEAIERAAGPAATTTDCEAAAAASGARAASVSSLSPMEWIRDDRPRRRGFITYPTNYLLAVADTTTEAASAVAALSSAGFPASDVVVIAGPEAGGQLARLGRKKGPLSELVRLIQFTTMDQMPDFRVYEDALLDDRTIVGVRVIDAHRIPSARDVLVAGGLHFLNFFGRWSTMEVSPWRGPELDEPGYLRR